MCLTLLDKPRVQKRKRPVVCFKVLLFVDWKDEFQAPFKGTRYRSGETKKVVTFSGKGRGYTPTRVFRDSLPAKPIVVVHRGLHVYESIGKARRGAYYKGRIIVRCVIPPSTPYIRGEGGEIATLALQVGTAVYGKKRLQTQFNKNVKRQRTPTA